jgi:hypothetical protein
VSSFRSCIELCRQPRSAVPLQALTVVPWHPVVRILLQVRGVLLQLGQIIERVGAAQLRRVDKAHVQVADASAVPGLIEKRVLSVEDRFFQCSFTKIMPTPGLWRVHWILEVPQGFKMVADAA